MISIASFGKKKGKASRISSSNVSVIRENSTAGYANSAGYATKAGTAEYAERAGIAENLSENSPVFDKVLLKTGDTATGLIGFLQGLITGEFSAGVPNSGASIDALGNGEFQSLTVRDFISALRATIATITTDNLTVNSLLTALEAAITTLTVENLTVTGAAHFFKLIIDELKSVGGMVMITAANATVSHVESVTGGYKCYFRSSDGDRKIYNQFEVGDAAICQTFDVAEGVNYNVSNKYYWRRVVAVGTETIDDVDYHYITLSSSDCATGSDEPEAGDEIAQLGYYATGTLTDDQKARQSAIVISSYNSNDPGVKAPYFAQYAGINDFNLSSHRLNWIARNGIQMTGVFKSIVDGQERNIIDILDDLASQFDEVKAQVDNKFYIWYGHGVPTLNNEPASAWTTNALKAEHLQDIYYDLDREAASQGGNCYRFSYSASNGYYWDKVTDSKTLAVLEQISDVASDGILSGGMEKARIYIEWMAAVSDYSYYLQQVTTMGMTTDNEWLLYIEALEALGTFLNNGSTWTVSSLSTVPLWINDTNRSVTTGSPDNPISASGYRDVWTDYYEAYAALLKTLGVTTYNISADRTKVFVTAQSNASNPVPPASAITGETPSLPYKAGDFWLYTLLNGEQKLYICTVNRATSYSPSHWQDMSEMIISSDVRYNLRIVMDKLSDDKSFVETYSKAAVTTAGYIQVYVCDDVYEPGHYFMDEGKLYVVIEDSSSYDEEEVSVTHGSIAVVGTTVYQYRSVVVDNRTVMQWVDMSITDLGLCLQTVYAGTLDNTWKIFKTLSNNASEYDCAMVPNTFTAQFAAPTESLPNATKTITADGYFYYYNNGDAWEPYGDNRDHSVIQNLGDAIVMAVWGEDSSSQIAINRNSINALTTWQSTVDGQILTLNSGMATKVDVNGSGATSFASLYSNAVSNDGTIQKKAEMTTYVQKYTENGQDYLETGVKIKGDKIVMEGATTVNGNFSIDTNGNVDVKGTVRADILYRSVGTVQLSSSTPVVYDGTYDMIWLIGKGNFRLGDPASHAGRILEIYGYSETANSNYEPVISIYGTSSSSSNFRYIQWFGLPSGVVSTLGCVYMYTGQISFPGKPKAVFYSDGTDWYLMERSANTGLG